MALKFVLVLIFAIFVAIFAIQNAYPVDVQFFNYELADISQAVVILVSAIAGGLVALLFSAIRWISYKSKLRGSTKSITALENEVTQLKQKLEQATSKEEAATQAVTEAKAEAQNAFEEARKSQEEVLKSQQELKALKAAQIPQSLDASDQTLQEPEVADELGSQQETQALTDEEPKKEAVVEKRKWYQF